MNGQRSGKGNDFGYVGSAMGKRMEKRRAERKKERAEAIQQLKNFAFVVYTNDA